MFTTAFRWKWNCNLKSMKISKIYTILITCALIIAICQFAVCQLQNTFIYTIHVMFDCMSFAGSFMQAGFLPLCMECRRGLVMRIFRPYGCPSVRRSVRSCVCQTRELWQNCRKSVKFFIPYERSFSLVFLRKRMVGGGDPFKVSK